MHALALICIDQKINKTLSQRLTVLLFMCYRSFCIHYKYTGLQSKKALTTLMKIYLKRLKLDNRIILKWLNTVHSSVQLPFCIAGHEVIMNRVYEPTVLLSYITKVHLYWYYCLHIIVAVHSVVWEVTAGQCFYLLFLCGLLATKVLLADVTVVLFMMISHRGPPRVVVCWLIWNNTNPSDMCFSSKLFKINAMNVF